MMENRLIEIVQQLRNIEYGDDEYDAIVEELKVYCAIIMQLSNDEAEIVINKYINKDKKAFNNFFEQFPHGLIDITQQLLGALK